MMPPPPWKHETPPIAPLQFIAFNKILQNTRDCIGLLHPATQLKKLLLSPVFWHLFEGSSAVYVLQQYLDQHFSLFINRYERSTNPHNPFLLNEPLRCQCYWMTTETLVRFRLKQYTFSRTSRRLYDYCKYCLIHNHDHEQ